MNRLILAVVVTVSCAGNIFASGNALGSLISASPSLITDITVPVPVSVKVPDTTDISSRDSDNVLGPLVTTVKAAQRKELQDYGYYFAMGTYPAKTKLTKIFADTINVSESDMGDYAGYFKMSSGDPAVCTFAKDLRTDAKTEIATAGNTSAVIANNIQNVATASEKAFLSTQRFVTVQLASHNRQEDGDFDYRILIAQEKDGTLRVLSYTVNPY